MLRFSGFDALACASTDVGRDLGDIPVRNWSIRSRDLLNFVDTLRPNCEMWSESRSPAAGAFDKGWGEPTRTIVSGVTGLGVVGLIGTAEGVCDPKDVVNRSAKARSVLFYISVSMVQYIEYSYHDCCLLF